MYFILYRNSPASDPLFALREEPDQLCQADAGGLLTNNEKRFPAVKPPSREVIYSVFIPRPFSSSAFFCEQLSHRNSGS